MKVKAVQLNKGKIYRVVIDQDQNKTSKNCTLGHSGI